MEEQPCSSRHGRTLYICKSYHKGLFTVAKPISVVLSPLTSLFCPWFQHGIAKVVDTVISLSNAGKQGSCKVCVAVISGGVCVHLGNSYKGTGLKFTQSVYLIVLQCLCIPDG